MNDGFFKRTNEILLSTVDRLEILYKNQGLEIPLLESIIVRPEWNVVISSNGACSMVINFHGKYAIGGSAKPQIDIFRSLIGRDLFELSRELIGLKDLGQRSIGIGSINALSQPFLSKKRLEERGFSTCNDIFGMVAPDDVVAVVGYSYIANKLSSLCKEVHVTEMRPRHHIQNIEIGKEIIYHPRDIFFHSHLENENVLRESDVVFITASSIVNGTFGELLEYSKNARVKGIYGPSGSMLPDELIDRGLDFTWAYHLADSKIFMADSKNNKHLERTIGSRHRRFWILKEK